MRDVIRYRLPFMVSAMLTLGSAVLAGGGSRTGDSISVTGTYAIHATPDKRQIPLDAVYVLDYRSAKLYVTTPEISKTTVTSQLFSDLAIRDLIVDFKLNPGDNPHFLMNAASLGALGGGTSALFVMETTTKQLVVYWCHPKTSGLNAKPEFELVQRLTYGTRVDGGPPVDSTSTSGPITIQLSGDLAQVPLDAVYWLESSGQGSVLYTAVPESSRSAKGTHMVGGIASRNIAADFKLKPDVSPRFLINTTSLGATGNGMSALFVFEMTTKQLGVYRAVPQATARGAKPALDLIQIKPYEEPLPILPSAN